MRSVGLGALGASTALLLLASASQAQPPADTGPTGDPAGPGIGLTVDSGGDVTTTAPPGDPQRDQAAAEEDDEDKDKKDKPEKLPFRGSVFIFEQSASSQAVGIGEDFQSDNPFYELSFSFRPRYYVFDEGDHSINVNMRFDAYQELTNSDETTNEQEFRFGNTWLNAVYTYKAYSDGAWLTAIGAGPRFIFPTDKNAYRSGERLRLGGGASVTQGIPVAGEKKTWVPSASFLGSLYYIKVLNKTTTPTNDDLERPRQDTDGRSLLSSQLSGGAKVSHQLSAVISGELDITQSFHFGLSQIWIMQWTYDIPDSTVNTLTGPTTPGGIEDPQTFRVLPWFVAEMSYDVLPEVSLALGYYNVTNQVGPDGERRNIFWSPDARVFFDVTANLDEIFRTVSGARSEETESQVRRNARRKSHLGNL